MANTYDRESSRARVAAALASLASVEVVDLTREIDLASADIPLTRAYRVDAVHVYLDITNASTLLGDRDSDATHRRLLRFLHVFQRVVHRSVLALTDAFKIDLQNHRLHLIVFKPYDDEGQRVAVAVTLADLLRKVLAGASDLHRELPDVRVSAGIESGVALAVRNGTRGDRELLFLGDPANLAAKLVSAQVSGVHVGKVARTALGKGFELDADGRMTWLTPDQLATCASRANIPLTPEKLLALWDEELRANPIADFQFFRPTPPLVDLDLESLSPVRTASIESATIMADVDGFTAFVRDRIRTSDAPSVVRALHVIRKELRDVVVGFGGRKIRYVGDCIQGVLAEGARDTDAVACVRTAVLCAGALRSSFDVIREMLPSTSALGLGIGFEYGRVSVTRLGVKGSRDRCVVGRAVTAAQTAQEDCDGRSTRIGTAAYEAGGDPVRAMFGDGRKIENLDYNRAVMLLRASGEPRQAVMPVPSAVAAVIQPRAHCGG